jgi:RNA polymerase sigma factor for flagellar operon FliA
MKSQSTDSIYQKTLILEYSGLVKNIAQRIKFKLPAYVELNDLVQAGMIGLIDAALKFKEGEAQFSTYAAQRIKGSILDELRSSDWLPRNARKLNKDIDRATLKLKQNLLRTPTDSEIAKELGMNLSAFHQETVDSVDFQFLCLDLPSNGDSNESLKNSLFDNQAENALDHLISQRFSRALHTAIQQLSEREQLFMSLYYERDLNLKEIAVQMQVSEARASQIHSQIVVRLRAAMKDEL